MFNRAAASSLLAVRIVVALATCVAAGAASADVVQGDWHASGDGLITTDTVSHLDWLDLTVTQGMSINDVTVATKSGGSLAGFRIPRLNELVDFYGHAVGPVQVEPNGNTPIFDFTPEERAAQRRFVDLIGITFQYDFPDFGHRSDAIGLLRTTSATDDPGLLAGGLFYYFNNDSLSYSWFNDGYSGPGYSDPSTGVYLVRSLDAGVVPEPLTWVMLLTGFGLIGAQLRRRRARPSVLPA